MEQALSEMYGLMGLARHYDVFVRQTQKPALAAILRIQKQDLEVFSTSFAGFNFSLADYLGRQYNFNASVAVVDQAASLSLLGSEDFINV